MQGSCGHGGFYDFELGGSDIGWGVSPALAGCRLVSKSEGWLYVLSVVSLVRKGLLMVSSGICISEVWVQSIRHMICVKCLVAVFKTEWQLIRLPRL